MIRTSIFIGGSRLSDHDFSSVSLDQKIGGHHTFEIRLRQDAKKDMLLEKTKAWIGGTVALGFDNHNDVDIDAMPVKDIFKGIVTSLELSRKSGTGELVVKGHSPTVVMDDGPMTQSFTDTGLQEIVDTIFQSYGSAFPTAPAINPENFTPTIDYSVQYKESAFGFVNRLANRYGEWFYYNGLNLYFGKPEGNSVDLDFGENGLKYFDLAVEAAPIKFELKAYDYKENKALTAEAPTSIKTSELGEIVLGKSQNDVFKQKPSVNIQTDLEQSDLDEMADRRAIISADEMVVLNGVSTNCFLVPGTKINVQDKMLHEDFGTYIITNIAHNVGQGGDYSNSFDAVPIEIKVPPLSGMPDAPFCETQLGIVHDVNDPESLGRVQVSLLWQEESGDVTPWIRVASTYTGEGKGFYIIPEVGDQVLVAFENNNAEKPYVLSGMYHGGAKPEWFNDENDIKGFKTRANNQWKFDDKNQSILLSAPNEMTLHAGNKITLKTEGKEDSEIHIDVGGGTVKVVANIVEVESAETVNVKVGTDLSISSGNNTTINSGDDMTIKAGRSLKESAGDKVEMKSKMIEAKADISAKISGKKVEVKGDGAVSVKSSGIMELKGSLVKIN